MVSVLRWCAGACGVMLALALIAAGLVVASDDVAGAAPPPAAAAAQLLDGPPFEVYPDLGTARALWEATKPEAYSYTAQAPPVGDVPDELLLNPPTAEVVVRGDEVVNAPGDPDSPIGLFRTIDALFDQIEAGELPVVSISYDPTYGYPLSVYSCWDEQLSRCSSLRNFDLIDLDPPANPLATMACDGSMTVTPTMALPGDAVTFTLDPGCSCPLLDGASCDSLEVLATIFDSADPHGDYLRFTAVDAVTFDALVNELPLFERLRVRTAMVTYVVSDPAGIYAPQLLRSQAELEILAPPVDVPGPGGADNFVCRQRADVLRWTDFDKDKYWVYATAPDGDVQQWIGRTLGETNFVVADPVPGADYFVHYAGVAREPCFDEGLWAGRLECASDGGALTWNDRLQVRYWVYKSLDDGATWTWLGRTLGDTSFTDPRPTYGALYQVRQFGELATVCSTRSEPDQSFTPFTCSILSGVLSWRDHDQDKYWVYRSTDGGDSFAWIGRTLGRNSFVDPAPVADAMYEVHYAGIPRTPCGPVVQLVPTPDPNPTPGFICPPTPMPIPTLTAVPGPDGAPTPTPVPTPAPCGPIG